ncbi:MAG: hypothetical protein QOH58_1781 [Thermoleophilaceae bacterium]|jgi:hypothetical protein|nr:hypothetical protein [Thermoleophilaceae bacterium]
MAGFRGVGGPIYQLGAVVALLATAAPAFAQSGGTPVPVPQDPCPAAYPGDDADRQSLARWMARGAALRDLPQELPVMAGLAESGLRNLNTRGNPFAGFFSMHRALDAGPYRGFAGKPRLQLRWFLDAAVRVRQRELAEGDEDFGSDSSGYGLWIADVERPAPENRSGYQRYFVDADALLTESCRPASHVADERPPVLRVKASGRQRGAVVVTARCPAEPCMVAAQAEPAKHVRVAAAVDADADPVTLTLPARARRSGRLVVAVTAADESGNTTRVEKRVTLLR